MHRFEYRRYHKAFLITSKPQSLTTKEIELLKFIRVFLIILFLLGIKSKASSQEGILDNSFLIEEAYNQESGVVQHILNLVFGWDKVSGNTLSETEIAFTQEWPLFSQKHQLSYTVPFLFLGGDQPSTEGISDLAFHYRYQALSESKKLPAFAPRFSLILPTGNEGNGLGSGVIGYQINLPVSKKFLKLWNSHLNLGATLLPQVEQSLPLGGNVSADLISFNAGLSAIYLLKDNFNLMLEFLTESVQELDASGSQDRSTTAIISPGLRYAINTAAGAQWVLGIASPLALTKEGNDYGIFLYLSFEHFFKR